MALKVAIVGLPNVGKSTLFNALTQTAAAQAANYPFCTIEPNVGDVAVPEPRLEKLATISKSKEIIPARINFVDIAGLVRGASKGEGLGNQFLANIRDCDAVAFVARCFVDGDVTHVEGRIDPLSDLEIVDTELMLADLESLEKRHDRLEKMAKQGDKDSIKTLALVKLALAQLNPTVGDVAGNLARLRAARAEAAAAGAELVMFPELFLSAYPPEDLVLKPAFVDACRAALEDAARDTADGGPAVLVGLPWAEGGKVYNAYAALDGGRITALRFKVDLPNYGVFDEKRVFAAGPLPGPFAFRNRLRIGMPLQSDPTIIYGLTRGYPLGHGIRQSELDGATPYNTYVIDGLPPGPIANPGKDALLAVLNPPPGDDLYFVADGQGKSLFAASIAEHARNVSTFRATEKLKTPRVPTDTVRQTVPRLPRRK